MARKKNRKKKRPAAPALDTLPIDRSRAYEAALSIPTRRSVIGADKSQDAAADHALSRIRDWGRYLDENHDLASGCLDELVKNIVGCGIVTIPKPLNVDGSVNEELGKALITEWRRWMRRADVTGELSWNDVQRIMCRGWMRDGEAFAHHVAGRGTAYPFTSTDVPYRLELLESEMVPHALTTDGGWRQGIRHNAWRMPVEYAVFREHPGDSLMPGGQLVTLDDVRRTPARLMTHLKTAKRWPSTRGISPLSTVVSRLYDIKDLEESERLKNRILASWVAAIVKSPDVPGYEDTDESGNRYLGVAGGTMIDTLRPGETITGVGPEYPVAAMPEHIADQIRRVSSGMGVRYSSISKHYEGSYSAMRQELVESEGHYQMREDAFVEKVCRTVYELWLIYASLDGRIALPPLDMSLLANAEYRGPVTPWIDPLKEVQADALSVAEGFTSIDQIRIKRGAPAEMIGQPAPAQPAPTQLALIDDDEDDAA